MTLRARLLIVLGILAATYVVAAYAVLSTQRDMLIDQVDNVLLTLPPPAIAGLEEPLPGGTREVTQQLSGPGEDRENPFTDVYVAVVTTGEPVSELLTSSTIGSPPDIEEAVERTGGGHGIVTVGSVEGGARFRALVMPSPDEDRWFVAAQPLADTDAAVARLQRTLLIAGVVIFAVLGVASFWIYRLGLLPIARVTAAAEAIAAGDRARRLEVGSAETEAGKLGVAFNVMLDERDAGENRLRQFVADASHELRTPITSVRGYLELFRQGAFREQTQVDDVIRRLSAEAARMNGLVEDLLALASLDEGRPLRREPVDLGQIVRDAAQDAGATQPARRIDVDAPAHGPEIVGDESLLIQLVGILVANALAHTPVTAPIILSASQNPNRTAAILSVADQGPGLEEEAAAKVFDRFWRAESSRNRKAGSIRVGGAGLGLAIAHSITEAHNGTITLDTAPGAGCIFTVRLPATA